MVSGTSASSANPIMNLIVGLTVMGMFVHRAFQTHERCGVSASDRPPTNFSNESLGITKMDYGYKYVMTKDVPPVLTNKIPSLKDATTVYMYLMRDDKKIFFAVVTQQFLFQEGAAPDKGTTLVVYYDVLQKDATPVSGIIIREGKGNVDVNNGHIVFNATSYVYQVLDTKDSLDKLKL